MEMVVVLHTKYGGGLQLCHDIGTAFGVIERNEVSIIVRFGLGIFNQSKN